MWTDEELITNLRLFKALVDRKQKGPLTTNQHNKLVELDKRFEKIDILAFLLKHIEGQDMKIKVLQKRVTNGIH